MNQSKLHRKGSKKSSGVPPARTTFPLFHPAISGRTHLHITIPPHHHRRALVELAELEEEKAKRAKVAAAGGEQEDPELLARVGVVRDGIYKRMKLLASWADLDDDQVRVDITLLGVLGSDRDVQDRVVVALAVVAGVVYGRSRTCSLSEPSCRDDDEYR